MAIMLRYACYQRLKVYLLLVLQLKHFFTVLYTTLKTSTTYEQGALHFGG